MHLSQAIFHTPAPPSQTDKQDRALLINLTTFKARDKRIIRDLCKLAWDAAKTLGPLAYSGPDGRGGRRISISVIALRHGEEVWGGKALFLGDKDFFLLFFQSFFILFIPLVVWPSCRHPTALLSVTTRKSPASVEIIWPARRGIGGLCEQVNGPSPPLRQTQVGAACVYFADDGLKRKGLSTQQQP